MYNTDEELDRELEELRKQIQEEAEQTEIPATTENDEPEQPSEDDKILEAVKALFDENMSADDIINSITDAVNTSCKRFKIEYDIDSLIEQEGQIKDIYPDFEIASELKNNVRFKRLIANGVDVHSALLVSNAEYADCIADIIKRDAKREMADQLRKGKERIMPEINKKSVTPEYDIGSMSDEQFEEIEKKVKQNKRVFL